MNLDMINVLPSCRSVVGFRCGRRDVAEIPSRSPAGSVLFFLYCLFLVFIVVSLNFLFTFN